MKKIVLFLTMFIMVLPVRADEGMWFLMFIERLNHRDMEKMGLQLTAEEIYSINNHSLKDAIVQFNGGCTAEIISKDGLVLTNHHCGYDLIAELSTPEANYLKNGYWAKTRKDELKPKEVSVRFFVRMDDVSKRILSKLTPEMTEEDRQKAIQRESALIEQENNDGGKYTVSVRPFFEGNEFYYFVYQDFTDVRLVGTPPENIGKFGGDTDNWEWPRHTGDFSMFRVYADADGNPAEYSPDNVPLKPKHHLPVSLKGVQENDFAMILGYPGRTNRWMPAGGIEQNVKFAYPAWVESSKLGMDKMKVHMDKDDKVRLNYASQYAQVANYWKNRQGMIDALTQHKTAATKAKDEAEFNKWANKKENKEKYGNVIATINNYYSKTNEKARHDNYLVGLLRTSTLAVLPYSLGRGLEVYANANEAAREQMLPQLKEAIAESYATLYMPLEKDVLAAQLNLYATKSTGFDTAPYVSEVGKANNYNYTKFINDAFDASIFSSEEKVMAFLQNQLFSTPKWLLDNTILNKISNPVANERVQGIQTSVLKSLLDKGRLLRLTTSSTRFSNASYALTDMMDDVRKGLFSELATQKATDVFRRNLQKTYVSQLNDLINPSASPAAAIGGFRIGAPVDVENSDVYSEAKSQLKKLAASLRVASSSDAATSNHYADLQDRIKKALDPK